MSMFKKILCVGLMMVGCALQADSHPVLNELEIMLRDKEAPATSDMLSSVLTEIANDDLIIYQQKLFDPVIKMFVSYGCDLNKTFYLRDTPEFSDMKADNFWYNKPVNPLILIATGFDMDLAFEYPVSKDCVQALLNNGARIVIDKISALDVWAEWYAQANVRNKENQKHFQNTLKIMFDAADKAEQNRFLKLYPKYKTILLS